MTFHDTLSWYKLPKFHLNCVFPQIFGTRKLGKVIVFYAVSTSLENVQNSTNRISNNYFPKLI